MDAKMLSIALALALVTVPATAMAGHADRGDSHDAFPGLPGAALFGLCQASDHADENATLAPPFAWLFANEDCEQVDHPRDEAGSHGEEQAADASEHRERGADHRPDHAGPHR